MNSSRLVKKDLKTVWHPCTQMKDHEKIPMIPIKSGKGIWLYDYDDNKYLDAISSWWVNIFGHSNTYINNSIKKQLSKLEHVLLAGFTHEPAINLAEGLMSITPKKLPNVFFTDNGSSSIDAAMKMSYHYWQNKGKKSKKGFIALSNSYHGETLGSLSVSNIDLYKKTYKSILKDTIIVDSPDSYHKKENVSEEEHAEQMFNKMYKALKDNHRNVCAVIVEPLIQCAGYMRMYHHKYLELLREACTKFNVHLIADEIAVGFGRTGTMFGFEQAKITPDIICLSKGITGGYMTLSTILTTDDIYDAFYDEYEKLNAFLHSHSYTANPIACSAANATLDLFKKKKVIDNNKKLSLYMKKCFESLNDHPHVSDVRQKGMVLAIELVKNKKKRLAYNWKERRGIKAYLYGLKNNVLMRPLGNVLYFMPPYVITKKEISFVSEIMKEGVDEATKKKFIDYILILN